MLKSFATSPNRLIASLCAALMLFYAATIPTKAMDKLQHAPAVMAEHDHVSLANFSVDVVHDSHEHHDDGPQDGGSQPDDHLAGGHHHHGDSSPSLMFPEFAANLGSGPLNSLHGLRNERQFTGLISVGPERPPRPLSLTA